MPKIKLTKTTVDAATLRERDYELRDTTIAAVVFSLHRYHTDRHRRDARGTVLVLGC